MKIGTIFQASDKFNNKTEWVVKNIKYNGYYVLSAIGDTLERYKNDLQKFKQNNRQCESIMQLSLDEFSQIEVEPEWFNQRNIMEL